MEIQINDTKTGKQVFFAQVEETSKLSLNKLIATALDLPAGNNFQLIVTKNGHAMDWKVEAIDVRKIAAMCFDFTVRGPATASATAVTTA